MTTATVPDVDLEAWLAGEIEEPCEAVDHWSKKECGKAASWLMRLSCCYPRTRFVCDECKADCDRLAPLCMHCEAEITVTWMERIR